MQQGLPTRAFRTALDDEAQSDVAQIRHLSAMKVIVAHNAYQYRGGEDAVVDAEVDLLRRHGHEVLEYRRHNNELKEISTAAVAVGTFWSRRTVREVGDLIHHFHPDLVHAHNTFPLISPSLYWTASAAGVPVIQTLHNFRYICPQAMFLRDGKVCEDCLGKLPWRGVVHACYRASVGQSAVLAGMLTVHRGLKTFQARVSRYIALNEFCKRKFVEGGLPAERIVVKPNFVESNALEDCPRNGLLFVGRLSPEKGIDVLVRAAALAETTIKVVGTGPQAERLQTVKGIEVVGELDAAAVHQAMLRAVALVLPSIWYENYPRTLVEAFAAGLPVIASRLGALPELIDDGVTGLLFDPGDPAALASKMRWATAHPEEMARMGAHARQRYESEMTATRNHELLMSIYHAALVEQPRLADTTA